MNGLDLLLAGAQVLVINHDAIATGIDCALYYGPGVVLTAVVVGAWRAKQWVGRRIERAAHRRAVRRHYTDHAHEGEK
ncbi:hypothetical protein ABZ401_19030 [Streptomyces sp. NPDC005892]|uniref:hypothetical protein n=1 Tax=Streptomyces sp. NPDC005892 TaxID=3155593 RepID=UPI0033EE277B